MCETFTTDQASIEAKKWCDKHPGWQRICDIENHDKLYKSWEELKSSDRKWWKRKFGTEAKEAWKEFGTKKCKVKNGFISGKGKFYSKIEHIPNFHQGMMVFKIGVTNV